VSYIVVVGQNFKRGVIDQYQFAFLPIYDMSRTKKLKADRLNLYTWFPFKLEQCGEVQDVILLDEWVSQINGRFLLNAHLYPAKIPKGLLGLPIKLAVLGKDLSLNITENSTENDYRKARKAKHIAVKIVQLVCDKMNLTTIFLAPSLDFSPESYIKEFDDLIEGSSDFLAGFIPLISIVVTSSFEAKFPMNISVPNVCSVSKTYSWIGQDTDNFLAVCVVDNWPCAAANHSCVLVCQ